MGYFIFNLGPFLLFNHAAEPVISRIIEQNPTNTISDHDEKSRRNYFQSSKRDPDSNIGNRRDTGNIESHPADSLRVPPLLPTWHTLSIQTRGVKL
jgi:hypothetical protein